VAHGGLGDVAARREVAGTDPVDEGGARGELPQDREPGGVRRTLEEEGIGVDETLHGAAWY
jgi:hypothetical protein